MTLIDLVDGWAMFRTRLVVICCNYIQYEAWTAAVDPSTTLWRQRWEQVPNMFPTAHQIHARAPASALPQRTWAPWGQKCPTYSGIVLVEKWSSSSSAYDILRLGAPGWVPHHASVTPQAWYLRPLSVPVWRSQPSFEPGDSTHALKTQTYVGCVGCVSCVGCVEVVQTQTQGLMPVDALKNLRACTAARAESITKFAACGSSRVSPSCGYVSVARTSRDERCVDPGGGRRSRIILLPSNLPYLPWLSSPAQVYKILWDYVSYLISGNLDVQNEVQNSQDWSHLHLPSLPHLPHHSQNRGGCRQGEQRPPNPGMSAGAILIAGGATRGGKYQTRGQNPGTLNTKIA